VASSPSPQQRFLTQVCHIASTDSWSQRRNNGKVIGRPTGRDHRSRLAVLALLTACGCGHAGSVPRSSPVARTTVPTSSTKIAAGVLTLSEAENGGAFKVRLGDSVTVVLHSTYWSMRAPSNPAVLRSKGPPIIAPHPQGCVAGQGCGTLVARYRADAVGQSQLTAHRETCGEAMRCAPDQSVWRATVTVST